MGMPCFLLAICLRTGPLEADSEKQCGFQGVYWGTASIRRGGMEADWAEETELQGRLSKALASQPCGDLVVVRVSFPP